MNRKEMIDKGWTPLQTWVLKVGHMAASVTKAGEKWIAVVVRSSGKTLDAVLESHARHNLGALP